MTIIEHLEATHWDKYGKTKSRKIYIPSDTQSMPGEPDVLEDVMFYSQLLYILLWMEIYTSNVHYMFVKL